MLTAESKHPAVQEMTAPSQRLVSLDALRGFDMFWIVGGDWLVRSLSKIYDCPATRELKEQMEHLPWEGFHFYDLIFPLFVFMVGMAIVFSVPLMIQQKGMGATIRRIVIRSVILFLLGILYMGGVSYGFHEIYMAGVLHRIAVCYFFTALIFCFCNRRSMLLICFLLLVGYWALMAYVPVPGFGEPSFEKGKNLAHYLDQYLPGKKFEGTLLSTMSAVANCLLGVFAGLFVKSRKISDDAKPLFLIGAGIISLYLGFAWGEYFPIVKVLWTSSYTLVAAGYSAILLGIFFQIIDVWKFQKWAQPFVWIGMNAITIYLVSALVGFRKVADRFVGGSVKNFFNEHLSNSGDFVQAAVAMLIMFAVVRFLYKRKIFLRL
jgi:predicted acyltransferase